MKTKMESINEVLAEWNPLDVTEHIAMIEYIGYVPLIIENMGNEMLLFNCIEDIITNKMELEYDRDNIVQKNDLETLCKKLMTIK
jgi:hypothetical protein